MRVFLLVFHIMIIFSITSIILGILPKSIVIAAAFQLPFTKAFLVPGQGRIIFLSTERP